MRIETLIRPDGSKRVMHHCDEPSLTRQEFKDECDLGLTLKRFCRTPEGREAFQKAQGFVGGRFEDVSNVPDYRTARDQINRANEVFMGLPALVRKRFDNDAAQFLDFIDDSRNLDEMKQMGLLKPEVVEKTAPPAE